MRSSFGKDEKLLFDGAGPFSYLHELSGPLSLPRAAIGILPEGSDLSKQAGIPDKETSRVERISQRENPFKAHSIVGWPDTVTATERRRHSDTATSVAAQRKVNPVVADNRCAAAR